MDVTLQKWIYREDTRTNHIKCKSESEYGELPLNAISK